MRFERSSRRAPALFGRAVALSLLASATAACSSSDGGFPTVTGAAFESLTCADDGQPAGKGPWTPHLVPPAEPRCTYSEASKTLEVELDGPDGSVTRVAATPYLGLGTYATAEGKAVIAMRVPKSADTFIAIGTEPVDGCPLPSCTVEVDEDDVTLAALGESARASVVIRCTDLVGEGLGCMRCSAHPAELVLEHLSCQHLN
jgi:hypothetical protein